MKVTSIPIFLTSLRNATKAAHQALEDTVESNKLIQADGSSFSLPHYRALLGCHYVIHRKVSHQFFAHQDQMRAVCLDWPDCERIQALEKDLGVLEFTFSTANFPTMEATSIAQVLGMCYVVEGSCMGNMQLLKGLSKSPDFNEMGADHFLKSCKTDFSHRWKQFIAYLTPYGEERYEELEAGASQAFSYFKIIWPKVYQLAHNH